MTPSPGLAHDHSLPSSYPPTSLRVARPPTARPRTTRLPYNTYHLLYITPPLTFSTSRLTTPLSRFFYVLFHTHIDNTTRLTLLPVLHAASHTGPSTSRLPPRPSSRRRRNHSTCCSATQEEGAASCMLVWFVRRRTQEGPLSVILNGRGLLQVLAA